MYSRSPLSPMRFTVAALATWRLTHLLVSEDGPGAIVARTRVRLGTGSVGELADCFLCLSLWIAAPFAVFVTANAGDAALTWLALSGAACQFEALSARAASELIDLQVNAEQETTDGMLRTA